MNTSSSSSNVDKNLLKHKYWVHEGENCLNQPESIFPKQQHQSTHTTSSKQKNDSQLLSVNISSRERLRHDNKKNADTPKKISYNRANEMINKLMEEVVNEVDSLEDKQNDYEDGVDLEEDGKVDESHYIPKNIE